jgi:hypothetical protein
MATKRTVSRVRAGYQQANEQAAGIVLQDIAKYGGEGAGLVIWARMVLQRTEPTIKGPLFRAAAVSR